MSVKRLLNDLCYYVNKSLSVKPLSSTWITSVFITICSLEIVQFVANLAMITALKCSGLSHAFHCVVEKHKNVIHQPRSVRIGRNCAHCLEYRYPRPPAQFFPIRTSRLVKYANFRTPLKMSIRRTIFGFNLVIVYRKLKHLSPKITLNSY